MSTVNITNEETGEVRSYALPHSSGIKVADGDYVDQGAALNEGQFNPHDVLRVRGAAAAQYYLTQEVQRVYCQQGVDINDKHIEVIVRQMMRKIRIEDSGDTNFLTGVTVDLLEYYNENERIQARIDAGEVNEETGEQLRLATGTRIMMGITKASLATESFLSAASFQETTKVLTEAAIKGKVDHLVGLKENVIIGKLIPAGSGLDMYRAPEAEEESPKNDEEIPDFLEETAHQQDQFLG